MPTQAEAYAVLLPEGALGVGTVNVPVTAVQVASNGFRYERLTRRLGDPAHRGLADDRASPVRRVLDVRVVRRERREALNRDLGLRTAAQRTALETTSEALARRGSRESGAGEESSGESELHDD